MGVDTPEWDPLPAIGKSAVKFVAGKVAGLLASLLLLPVGVAAARATGGWVHLLLGLGVFCLLMALAQAGGALLAARGWSAAGPLVLIAKVWVIIAIVAIWPLLSLAGVSDQDKQPMLSGVAAGAAFVLVLWLGWGLAGRLRPGLKYDPAYLRGWQWYLRLSMNLGGLVGGLAAIGIVHR
jgi:hypothetical protein